jgi:hypothetical protein
MHIARQQDSDDNGDGPDSVGSMRAISETLALMVNPFNKNSSVEFADALHSRGYAVVPISSLGNNIFAEGYFDGQ